ncbi:zonular occludens toxin domain-containing protein, partial [Acinetobacter entericus]
NQKEDRFLIYERDLLTLHGHFGIDIYFITQKPYKLNDSVKASVNEHLILRRLFKLKACTIYSFSELQEQFGLSTMRNALSWKFWLYPKQLYKFYISAEEHEKSTKIPFSLIFWLILPVFIICAALYKSMGTRLGQKFFGSEETSAQVSPAANPNSEQTIADQYQPQKKIIDCMVQFSYTKQQCEEMLNHEIRDKRHADLQASTHRDSETIAMNYKVNDPYGSQITEFQIQAKDYPRLSGCVQYGNKIVGFDQQGNRMPDLEPNACKRWLAGERLFDYTRDRSTASMQAAQPPV